MMPPVTLPDPIELESPARDVALWWCSLDPRHGDRALLERWLSEAERARMRRFGNEALRGRYLIGRASLRSLLSLALGIDPAAVPIVRDRHGRPRLDGSTGLDFNLSHTADAALIGIARGARIGVDIERSDRTVNVAGISRKFMSARERATLSDDPAEARRQVLRRWTCKEALAKATGDALSAPFARIDVEIASDLRLTDGPPPYVPTDWSLHEVDVPEGFLGTLALWRPPS